MQLKSCKCELVVVTVAEFQKKKKWQAHAQNKEKTPILMSFEAFKRKQKILKTRNFGVSLVSASYTFGKKVFFHPFKQKLKIRFVCNMLLYYAKQTRYKIW